MSEKEKRIVAEASHIVAIGTFVVEKRVYELDEDSKASCALTLTRSSGKSPDRFTTRFYGDSMKECGDMPLHGKVEVTWGHLPGNIFHVEKLLPQKGA